MENPITMDVLRVPLVLERPIWSCELKCAWNAWDLFLLGKAMEDMAHNTRGMLHLLWWGLDDVGGFSKVEIS